MRVSELVQRPGSFTLPLRVGTPRRIRDELVDAALGATGIVYVYPGSSTRQIDASRALWGGYVRTHDEEGSTFGGFGVSGILGTDEGIGPHEATTSILSAQPLSTRISFLLPRNSVTVGTVTNPAGDVKEIQWTPDLSMREVIDASVSSVGCEWQMSPDHVLDAGPVDVLYSTTPTVMITPRPTAEFLGGGGLRGISGELVQPTTDATGVTSQTTGFGEGTGMDIQRYTATAGSVVSRNYDGNQAESWRKVDIPEATEDAIQDYVNEAQQFYENPIYDARVVTRSKGIRRVLVPGDRAYVYDPRFDMRGNPLVGFGGEPTYPLTVRILEMDWTVPRGMGVWLRRATGIGAFTWTNLTDFVAYGSGEATLRIAEKNRLAGVVFDRGNDRLGGR